MKIVKKLMTALLGLVVVAAAVMIPNTAKAAGVTFTVHWNGSDWYFQRSTDSNWMHISSIDSVFADGDILVIDSLGDASAETCEVTITKRIGEACVANGVKGIINATVGVSKAYGASNGIIVINGNVDEVFASANGVIQVNGNVNVITTDYSAGNARYAVTGTVNKATAKINSETPDTYYAIPAGKMIPAADGIVWLADGQFSRTPVDGGSVINTPATTAPAGNANNQLDEVPKTGSFVFEISIVLLAAAAVFGVASAVVLRKKTR